MSTDTNTNAYCPRSFLRLYAWINTEKKNLANIQPSWPHAWSITIYVDPVIVQNTDWNIKDKLLSVPYTNTFVPRDKLSVALQRLHVWDSAKLRLEKKKTERLDCFAVHKLCWRRSVLQNVAEGVVVYLEYLVETKLFLTPGLGRPWSKRKKAEMRAGRTNVELPWSTQSGL